MSLSLRFLSLCLLSLRALSRAAGLGASLSLATALSVLPAPALAEPPPHAKAHGWRKKNDPTYAGYTGKQWERDYGIASSGRCDTDAVLTAVGGVVGGIIGASASRGGSESERAIAVIVGTAIGAVVGNRIGREIDRTDQGCIGHALEVGAVNKPVVWVNPRSGVNYTMVPLAGQGSCRNFRLEANYKGNSESSTRRACRGGDGTWQLQ